jgi:hypothetical protein
MILYVGVILLINIYLFKFVWYRLEELNLKGNLFGYDVYLINNPHNKNVKIVECLGIGILFILVIFHGF